MRKFVKAAAALTAGCMLLSTSAFAALTSSDVPTEIETNSFNVTIDGGLVAGESTILVLKGNLNTMPEEVSENDIVYIDQKTVAETTVDNATTYSAAYSIAIDEEVLAETEAVSIFAGGTAETAASWIGTVLYSTGNDSSLPEGAAIVIRNADPYGMTGYSVVKVTGIDAGSVAVKDADGTEVPAYLADYTADGGIRQYLAIVKGTEFTTDSIVWDGTVDDATLETNGYKLVFGDPSGDGEVKGADATITKRKAVDLTIPQFSDATKYDVNRAHLAADVSGDGQLKGADGTIIGRLAVGFSISIGANK